VTGLQPVHEWVKAGVMIRDTLNAGSPNAMIAVTGGAGGGATFQWRPQLLTHFDRHIPAGLRAFSA
jgi:hypothetical protein